MDAMFQGRWGEWARRGAAAALVLLAVFLGVKVLGSVMELRYVGAGISPANVISVSGYGEALAVPDIATFNFSVVSLKSTVAAAQEDATEKANAVAEYLEEQGIAERDIQTTNYSVYPQYDYVQEACPAGSIVCPGGRQVLRGYEVRQTTTIKVRDTESAGELLSGVGTRGATEVSGLSFTFDNPEGVEDEARGKAIADAKEKAEELADQLGVRLVRVVSFSENKSGSPMPTYRLDAGFGGATEQSAVAPEISVGENKTTSYVTVSYEIR